MVLAEDLRQAVLQAALQGKLTEQLETDSNVDEMLVSIREEKEKLIIDKRIKKERVLPEIQDEELPFDIPDNWRWVRLGDILRVSSGDGLTSKNMIEGTIPVYGGNGINGYHDKSNVNRITLTIGRVGANCGAVHITKEKAWVTDNAFIVSFYMKQVNICYWAIVLKTLDLGNKSKATAQPVISGKTIYPVFAPLPPIEEQQRIVDKINEIMPKIDEYEKIEKELETLKKEFPTDMKDALLQAAMQGKLTEQLESDSSVDELLEVIRKQKEKLIAQKKIKKEKPLSDIKEEEIPFDIPDNWRWVRLGNIGTLTRGSGIKRTEVAETGFPCVRYGELYTTYKTKFDVAVSHTSKELFDKSQKVNRNDILMALTGENNFDIALALAYVGDETVAMGGDLTRWSNHHMNPLYLVYAMNSSYAIHKKSEMAKGDIIVHISNDKLSTILLPIPPIEEQNRIVEKLDVLLPLCEALKEE